MPASRRKAFMITTAPVVITNFEELLALQMEDGLIVVSRTLNPKP